MPLNKACLEDPFTDAYKTVGSVCHCCEFGHPFPLGKTKKINYLNCGVIIRRCPRIEITSRPQDNGETTSGS